MAQHLLTQSSSRKDKVLAYLNAITQITGDRLKPKCNMFFSYKQSSASKALPFALLPHNILCYLNFVDLLQLELTCLDFFVLINSETYCAVIWKTLIGVGTMSSGEAHRRRELIKAEQYPFAPTRTDILGKTTEELKRKKSDGVYASCLAVTRRLSKCAERKHRVQLVDVSNLAFWTPLTLARMLKDLTDMNSTAREFLPLEIRAHPLHISVKHNGSACEEIAAVMTEKLGNYNLATVLAGLTVSYTLDPRLLQQMFRYWYGKPLHKPAPMRLVRGSWKATALSLRADAHGRITTSLVQRLSINRREVHLCTDGKLFKLSYPENEGQHGPLLCDYCLQQCKTTTKSVRWGDNVCAACEDLYQWFTPGEACSLENAPDSFPSFGLFRERVEYD